MIVIYGIKNCNTCIKVRKHFGDEAEFYDVRDKPLPSEKLKRFISIFGEHVINLKSNTWRELNTNQRRMTPLALLQTFPTIMKRPVIEDTDTATLTLGWSEKIKSQYK